MKFLVAITLLFSLGAAPFQCGPEPTPELALEDSPSEALWNLSERFRTEGQDAARLTTLRQLTEQYPTSREAERARQALEATAAAADSSGSAPAATTP